MMKLERNISQTRIALRLMDKIMKFKITTSFPTRTIMADMNDFKRTCRTASLFNF